MGPKAAQANGTDDDALKDLLPDDQDLLYEEELLRNPYSLRMWWRYLEARKEAPARRRYLLFERALKALPGSYKLWHAYLQERHIAVRGLVVTHPAVEALNNTYERALVSMHKMPRIWLEYLEFLIEQTAAVHLRAPLTARTDQPAAPALQKWVMRTRRTFDRALTSLPITQHDRIWVLYLRFLMQPGIPVETAVRVYRRYLRLEPTHAEEYITYLKVKGRWGEAARKLAEVVNDETFRSLEGKSRHQLWLELCDIITKHPAEVQGILQVDPILRSGIRRFTDEVGRLWTSLADYYIRRGLFEKARDVYEEGLTSVVTVRDFSLVFDALTQFEESLISAKMEQINLVMGMWEAADRSGLLACCEGEHAGARAGALLAMTLGGLEFLEPPLRHLLHQANKTATGSVLGEEEGEGAENGDVESDGDDFLLKDDGNDLDLRLARLEHLMERRPELLSSVMLRQNPHSVHEWHKRAKLFQANPTKQILTYTEAVKTVDPEKAIGKPHTLWVAFAKLYERHQDLPNARIIFEKAVQAPYKYVDDLATVWCEWCEMELRHKNFKRALEIMRRATAAPARPRKREEEAGLPVQDRLYRSLKLWSFYVDLEESLGTLETTRAVYEQILDLRIATPQIVLNYASFLQEHKFWEDSFRAYERGISLFKYPHVKDIWKAYLMHFVARYGGKKVERTRDLFRQAIEEAPAPESKPLFLQFAQFEEQHGLARNAMQVYDAAVKKVPEKERLGVYDIYIARASEFFGIGKVREIYEAAIEAQPPHNLGDADTRALCRRYAQLERKLGEVDRARAIYVHASSLADPRVDRDFWDEWNQFEVRHGNEDTFREMLRIKRSVAAAFSQMHFNTTIIDAAAVAASAEAAAAGKRKRGDDMAELEAQQEEQAAGAAGGLAPGTRVRGFVSAGVIQQGNTAGEEQQQEQAGGGSGAAAGAAGGVANPEDIELGDDDDDDIEEAMGQGGAAAGGGEDDDEEGGGAVDGVQLEQRAVPDEVFGQLAERFKKQRTDAGEEGGGGAS
ncbi:hypothetical protein N2152v2_001307 [Parachlorella kessleri]